ncbi:MAG: globin domain-containing protein [Raineya sp.]
MLSSQHKEIIKQSFPKVLIHTIKSGKMVYEKLFELAPETKALFQNTSMERQGQMLVAAIGKIVKGLDHPEVLEKELIELGKRHKGYGLQPEYFVHFGNSLMYMLQNSLADGWNAELEDAWRNVYQEVSEMMMKEIFTKPE